MSAFTKAPWLITGTDKCFVYAEDGSHEHQGANRFELMVQNGNHQTPLEELQANARLIAAAPMLYEACLRAVDCIENAYNEICGGLDMTSAVGRDLAQIRAAIAAAEGRTP